MAWKLTLPQKTNFESYVFTEEQEPKADDGEAKNFKKKYPGGKRSSRDSITLPPQKLQ